MKDPFSHTPLTPDSVTVTDKSRATFQIFVGADNDTGICDIASISGIVSGRHDGFTIQRSYGYWKGQREDSAVITVSDDIGKVYDTVEFLKRVLRQDAIAYIRLPDMQFA